MPRRPKRPKPPPIQPSQVPFNPSQLSRIRSAIHNLQTLLACPACHGLLTDSNSAVPGLLKCNHILCPTCTASAVKNARCLVCEAPVCAKQNAKDVTNVAMAVQQLAEFRQELDKAAPLSCQVRLRIRPPILLRLRVREPESVSVRLRLRDETEQKETDESVDGSERGRHSVVDEEERSAQARQRNEQMIASRAVEETLQERFCADLTPTGDPGTIPKRPLLGDNTALKEEKSLSPGQKLQLNEHKPALTQQEPPLTGHKSKQTHQKLPSTEQRPPLKELKQQLIDAREEKPIVQRLDFADETVSRERRGDGDDNHDGDDKHSPVSCRLRVRDSQSMDIDSRKYRVQPPQASIAAPDQPIPITSPTVLEEPSPHLSRDKSPFLSELGNESAAHSPLSADNVPLHAHNGDVGLFPRGDSDGPFYICFSKFSQDDVQVELAEEIVKHLGGEELPDFRRAAQPSCIVTALSKTGEVLHRTMIVHEAIAKSVPIVGLSWLVACFKAGMWLETRQFEATIQHRGDGEGIFHGVIASFDTRFETSDKGLARLAGEDIRRLMRAAGALISEKGQLAEIADGNSDIRLHVYVVCDFGEGGDASLRSQGEEMADLSSSIPCIPANVVNMAWISDCLFTGVCPPPQGSRSESASGLSEEHSGEDDNSVMSA